MKLKMEIELDNAAFFEDDGTPARNAEVSRILHTFAEHLDRAWDMETDHGFRLQDSNGNKVGTAEVVES